MKARAGQRNMKNFALSFAFLVIAGMQFPAAQAQPHDALAGQVTSIEEGPMEGVLVSARKVGSTITVTVVSDAQGHYRFPISRMEAGTYSLNIRAIGYDLDHPVSVGISGHQPIELDLKLRKTEDLAAQLTNAEWLASFPGNDQQKRALLGCVGCHTLERVARSQHKSDALLEATLPRMQGYVNQSIPAHPQLRRAERLMEERGDQRVQVYRALADYISTINLSSAASWNYELKTLRRPSRLRR
jgi:virginiamycin B lyase